MFLDDVKTSQLSYTPLDAHSVKGRGVNKKVQAEKKRPLTNSICKG